MQQSNIIIERILNKIQGFEQLLVGFSGGIDSTVLLHALFQIRQTHLPTLSIRAIHIHHGLNHKADAWEQHCAQLCSQWDIPFICRHVTVDPSQKGVEAAARDARYQAYREELMANEILVTAQHLDDQAETFMLALKRGSTPQGYHLCLNRYHFLL